MSENDNPRIGNFWFIAEPTDPPRPSRMVGQFSEIKLTPPLKAFDPSDEGRLYQNRGSFHDEDWPRIGVCFPFVGYRDHTFFPSGSVSWCPEDNSAHYLIDPALNAPEFLKLIAQQTRTSLERAVISFTKRSAIGRVGFPDQRLPTTLRWRCGTQSRRQPLSRPARS